MGQRWRGCRVFILINKYMVRQAKGKSLLKKWDKVWCVDKQFRLLYGVVEEVFADTVRCSMVNQNIHSSNDTFIVKMNIKDVKIRKKNL